MPYESLSWYQKILVSNESPLSLTEVARAEHILYSGWLMLWFQLLFKTVFQSISRK